MSVRVDSDRRLIRCLYLAVLRELAGRAQAVGAYTEHAAIILRKLGRRDDEILVLKRWLALCPPQYRDGSRIGERLAKLG